ncbi:MAG: LuxR C-terminal-related transcriptional regulator [Pseudomonadota bacterium]
MSVDALNVVRSVSTICGCEALTELGPSSVTPLMHAFEASSLLMLSQNQMENEGWQEAMVVVNQPENTLQRYFAHYRQNDPVLMHWRTNVLDRCGVFRLSDLSDPIDTDFVDFLRWANVEHMMVMSIPLGGAAQERLLIAMHRDASFKDFTPDECQVGEYLAPVLRQSFRGMHFKQDERAVLDVTNTFISKVSRQSLLLVDKEANVLDASQSARDHEMFRKLSARTAAFRRAIDEFLLGEARLQELVLEDGEHSIPLRLRQIEAFNQYVLVTLLRPEEDHALAWECLTPRQLEVARLVANGARNCQVADRLGVSENTVVNHLSTIYHKLGVNSRTALAAGWNRSPPAA